MSSSYLVLYDNKSNLIEKNQSFFYIFLLYDTICYLNCKIETNKNKYDL